MKLPLNTVFNEDVMQTLSRLPDNSVDMIFGDPDYNVGVNYAGANYTKKWDEYISWYIRLTNECMRVLKQDGNLFMLNYPKQNAYLRVKYLDDAAFNVYEYVWVYNTNVGHSPKKFTTAHRTILHAVKSKAHKFYKNNVAVPYQNPTDKRIMHNLANGSKGRMPYSWTYFDLVKNVSKDKTFHACQLPKGLVEMFIKAATNESDTVQILFGGSGNEILLCKELKRNFISSEIHKPYYDLIIDRLENGGEIKDEFRCLKKNRQEDYREVSLFDM
ncbi:MAG: site-specific DNA-methyltransferase [Defluviitaleaceae bacterium]|nr:site-specific DNA-methyltransferase [Defluviitaleaceae bacterium]